MRSQQIYREVVVFEIAGESKVLTWERSEQREFRKREGSDLSCGTKRQSEVRTDS